MKCENCGKELAEGEICTCTRDGETSAPEAEAQASSQNSSLPSGSDIAASAKSAAEAVKNNPFVGEALNAIKSAFSNPVKHTVESAKRTDILWAVLGTLELIITSLSMNIFVRRLIFFVMSESMKGKVKYGEFCKGMSELGFSSIKTFGLNLVIVIISFIAAVVLMLICTAVCRVKPDFSKVCNMLAGAFLPSAILLAISLVTSYIFVLISALLISASCISFTVLTYLGMQKLDKFEKSPFKVYVVYFVLLTLVVSLIGGKIYTGFIQNAFGSALGSLTNSLYW